MLMEQYKEDINLEGILRRYLHVSLKKKIPLQKSTIMMDVNYSEACLGIRLDLKIFRAYLL